MTIKDIPAVNIPDKNGLQNCLGPNYKLDGSFASLWAIEAILEIIRRVPKFKPLGDWIPDYLSTLFNRAYSEMGIEPKEEIDFTSVYDDLASPSATCNTVHGTTWSSAPITGLAKVPWFGFKTLGGSKEAIDWLTKEYVRSDFKNHPELEPMATPILSELLHCFFENSLGEDPTVLRPFVKKYEGMPSFELKAATLLKILTGQDRFLSILAGAACFELNYCPTHPQEAKFIRRSMMYYKEAITKEERYERVLEIVQMLNAKPSDALKGSDEPEYLNILKLQNEKKYEQVFEELTRLINVHPERALYPLTRGQSLAKLKRFDDALIDLDQACSLNTDSWRARKSRGKVYLQLKKYTLAQQDFFDAAKLNSDDEGIKNHLLIAYFLKKIAIR
jgi:tetratricopeptide (TPR) repeat protein